MLAGVKVPLEGMDPQVVFQVPLLGEPPVTAGAPEGFFSSVNSHVGHELPVGWEGFVA